jgi:hypothetical protein
VFEFGIGFVLTLFVCAVEVVAALMAGVGMGVLFRLQDRGGLSRIGGK